MAKSKILIAVPYFNAEGVPATYSKILADTLLSEFEKTGKIDTLGEEDVNRIIKQMEDSQALGDGKSCASDEKCAMKLGAKMQVDYIAISRVSKINNTFIISVRLLTVNAELSIPMIQKQAFGENDVIDTVKKIGADISIRFPLEGEITAIDREDKSVIISLGSSNNLKEGDVFFVDRERGIKNKQGEIEFSDRKRIGEVRLSAMQVSKSKAKIIDEDETFKEGDIVIFDQKKLLERLEKERKEEDKRIKEIEKQKEIVRKDSESEERTRKRRSELLDSHSFLRVGYGGFGLMRLADGGLEKYYGSGQGFMLDFFPVDYTNFRYTLKLFGMTGETTDRMSADFGITASEADLTIHNFDWGFRYIFGGYFFYELWQLYFSGSVRFAYLYEEAKNKIEKSFYSFGVVGGAGFEITIFVNLGIFAEYNYGYTPVGEKEKNIDGHQVYFGLTFRD